MMKKIKLACICAVVVFCTTSANASLHITVGFERITNNGTTNIAGQLFAEIMDSEYASEHWNLTIATNEILVVFRNEMGIASSNVHEIYFADGTLMKQTAVHNSMGVNDYTAYVGGTPTPSNLPGGNNASPPFEATVLFGADVSGSPNNGLNASNDRLGISIQLFDGLNFSHVVEAVENGALRIGLHVGSITDAGYSDSFVNTAIMQSVPEPGALGIWSLIGLTAMGYRRRAGAFGREQLTAE